MSMETPHRAIKEYLVFLASPGDVKSERDIVEKVINNFNDQVGRRNGGIFKLLRWENDATPYFHPDGAQGAVDAQMNIKECAVFIGIFWKRLGSTTNDGQTGTEHEFTIAYNHWKKTDTPYIMLFRSDAPIGTSREFTMEAMDQNRRLNNFFNDSRIKSQFVTPYGGGKEEEKFEKIFSPWFFKIAQDILDGKINFQPTEDNPDDGAVKKINFTKTGWAPITFNTLKQYYVDLPKSEAIDYFDGRDPFWNESISTSVARREIVEKVKNHIIQNNVSHPLIVLLKGLGGEGKSTILQQVIYQALSEKPQTYVLWHERTNTPLTIELIEKIAENDHEWIVASDDAHIIEKDLREITIKIRSKDIMNVRFLLATKDFDWNKAGGDNYGWKSKVNFILVTDLELTKEDAKQIVNKWRQYGDEGLGNLKNQVNAEEKLFSESQTEKHSQNSMLGAMIKVRKGTHQEHLRPVLEEFEKITIANNISLRRALAYIVALHSYNIKVLTPQILSEALGCSTEVLSEQVIKKLGKEINLRDYLLIRHTSIAEAYKQILSEDFDFYIITRKLLKAATQLLLQDNILSKSRNKGWYEIWWRLPRTIFFEKDDHAMGIALAEEIMEIYLDSNEKYKYLLVNQLTSFYRKDKQVKNAVKTHREKYHRTNLSRSYYYEWSVSEGMCNHHYLSVWLTGISLADGKFSDNGDTQRAFKSLGGLAEAFKFLYQNTNEAIFLNACYASAMLALKKEQDRRLDDIKKYAESAGAVSSSNHLYVIKEGIRLAYSKRNEILGNEDEYGVFPNNVPAYEKLTFTWLQKELI